MFLLRTKTRHLEMAQVYDQFMEAVEAAREHVGDHNPDDGCSTVRFEHRSSRPTFYAKRSTSFGMRQARVDLVTANERTEIMPW